MMIDSSILVKENEVEKFESKSESSSFKSIDDPESAVESTHQLLIIKSDELIATMSSNEGGSSPINSNNDLSHPV